MIEVKDNKVYLNSEDVSDGNGNIDLSKFKPLNKDIPHTLDSEQFFANKMSLPDAVLLEIGKIYTQPVIRDNHFEDYIKTLPIKTVKYKKIVPTQNYIHKEELKHILKEKHLDNSNLPFMIKYKGKYYLINGHHRTVYHILKDEKIKANVYKIK